MTGHRTAHQSAVGTVRAEVMSVAKNTGRGHRNGAVTGRSEFKVANTWFKRDTSTGRILNGSPNQHKGVRNER
jgi:hypothetical protein